MSDTLTPVDELRSLLDTSKTSPESVDHWRLRAERIDRCGEVNKLLTEVRGRAMTASEQRDYDRAYEAVDLIDKTLINVDKRKNDAAAFRAKNAHIFGDSPTDPTTGIGAQLRSAIEDVIEGRSAQAYVDYPETRAMSEGGNAGLGVETVFAQPVYALAAHSVVMNLPGIITVNATTGDRMRFPRFNAVNVAGVAEAAALPAANTDLDAIDVIYQKFATYETLSTELEEDFSAPALTVLGNRMLKDLAARVDSGLIQGTGAQDTVGIFSQAGVSTTSVAALPADMDKVSEAEYQLLLNDGEPKCWVMHPRSWRIYKQIKTGIASDKTTLLQPDPSATVRTLAGYPVFLTSAISILSGATSVGSTAALLDPSQIVVVTRRPARLEVSRDVNFSTDQVAIRATTRVGLGVIDPAGGISLLTDIRAS